MQYWIKYLEPHSTKNIDAMLFVPVGCCLRDRAEVCRALFFLGQYFLGRIFAPVAVPRNDSYLSQCLTIKVDALQVYNGSIFMKPRRVIS